MTKLIYKPIADGVYEHKGSIISVGSGDNLAVSEKKPRMKIWVGELPANWRLCAAFDEPLPILTQQQEVLAAVVDERAYQDATASQRDRSDAEHDVYDWYQIVDYYTKKWRVAALTAIVAPDVAAQEQAIGEALQQARKVAAVCVAAMEQLGCPGREKESQAIDGNAPTNL